MQPNKYVIIIQSNEHDVGKAVHGLLYGQELHEAGFEVDILFDGLGTKWPNEFSKADHPFHSLYKQVMKTGILKGGCQACSGFFEVEEEVVSAGLSLVGSEKTGGHIPFAEYMQKGYLPIVL